MKTVNCKPGARQRGIASVIVILVLVTAVVFVLVQTFVISGSSSSDQSRQSDRVGSLTLAESGLELATVKLEQRIADIGSFNSSTNCCIESVGSSCSSGMRSGALTLGGDSQFEFVSVVTDPVGCRSGCPACVVTVRGESGETTRTLRSVFRMSSMAFCKHDNDKDCSNQNAPSKTLPIWWLPLPGREAAPFGIGVFNLAAAGSVGCWSGGCLAAGDLGWQLSGTNIFGLGNTVPQTTAETSVYQRLSASTDVALTGALFPGVRGKTPTVVGSYAGITTKGSGTTGSTTDGADPQNAASWCYRDGSTPAGDTLVFGFSAHTNDAKKNELQTVLFDTRGDITGTKGIPLERAVKGSIKTKSPASTETAGPDTVYSELWYKQNAAYSYGTRIRGSIRNGQPVAGTITVDFSNNAGFCVLKDPSEIVAGLQVGDRIRTASGQDWFANKSASAIVTQITKSYADCKGNTYVLTDPVAKSSANNVEISASLITYIDRELVVEEFIGGAPIAYDGSDPLLVGVAGITNIPKIISYKEKLATQPTETPGYEGVYLLNSSPTFIVDGVPTATDVASGTPMVIGGASANKDGTVVSVPKVTTADQLPKVDTLLAVRLGSALGKGTFQAGTKVTAVDPVNKTFTVDKPIPVALAGAEICGGTCALFDHSSATTGFRLATSALPAGTDSWVAGFTCLDSVDGAARPTPLNSAPSVLQTWSEVAQ